MGAFTFGFRALSGVNSEETARSVDRPHTERTQATMVQVEPGIHFSGDSFGVVWLFPIPLAVRETWQRKQFRSYGTGFGTALEAFYRPNPEGAGVVLGAGGTVYPYYFTRGDEVVEGREQEGVTRTIERWRGQGYGFVGFHIGEADLLATGGYAVENTYSHLPAPDHVIVGFAVRVLPGGKAPEPAPPSPASPPPVAAAPKPVATLGLSATELDFGEVVVKERSSQTLTITNNGTAPLEIKEMKIQGDYLAFGFSPAPERVPAGGSATIEITANPTLEGETTGQLVFETNDDSHKTVSVDLKVTGVAPPALPVLVLGTAEIDFGVISLGKKSRPREFVINNNGKAPLLLTEIKTDNPVFQVTVNNLTIAAGSSGEIEVTASPTGEGEINGQLLFESNDPNNKSVAKGLKVQGNASVASMELSHEVLDFGGVTIGKQGRLVLTIHNYGTKALGVSGIKVTGDPSFTVATTELTIAPETSGTVEVVVSPKMAGAIQAQLELQSTDPNKPSLSIPLKVEGKVRAVAIADFFDLVEGLKDPNIRVDRAGGKVLIVSDVKFATGKATAPDARREATNSRLFSQAMDYIIRSIKGIEKVLPSGHKLRVRVVGHTDSVGSEASNQTLSGGRATMVAGKLHEEIAKDGSAIGSFETCSTADPFFCAEGKGESQPVANNNSEGGRAKNRRTEVFLEVILPTSAAPAPSEPAPAPVPNPSGTPDL
ncbi:MAG: choice-of-anchor D domain-containing protein [Deltaproteobacteria bacterium]|nr:choice-of-anchor D domain-containing protein [Deltaproteobacteria bacterium]